MTTDQSKRTEEESVNATEHVKTFAMYLDRAQQGDASAQEKLGYMYYTGLGTSRDIDRAVHWYEKSYENGAVNGGCALGELYEQSHQWVKAREWYERAAKKGHMLASWRLARLYRVGHELVDADTALHWLHIAAEAGHIPSRFLLLRQVWNGRIAGGKMRALFAFVGAVLDVFREAITGKLQPGTERLKK